MTWNLFDTGSTSHLSMDHARELAAGIAHTYLTVGTAPTETLTKVAQEEELTPHQIQLVAAESNKAIHAHKYAAMDEKYFAADFPLADAAQVIKSLQIGNQVKVAAEFSEPASVSTQAFDPYEAFGVKPEPMNKVAEIKSQLKFASVKMGLMQEKLRDKQLLSKEAAISAERTFIKTARQEALQGDSSAERLQAVGLIYKFAKEAGFEEAARPALAKLAYVLGREGKLEPKHVKIATGYFLTKKADEKAPIELISENLLGKVMVVNGEHPLYITLKTLAESNGCCQSWGDKLSIVEDKLPMVRQKIREL